MANKDENMLTWILAVRNRGVFAEVKVETIDKGTIIYLKDEVKIRVVSWYK